MILISSSLIFTAVCWCEGIHISCTFIALFMLCLNRTMHRIEVRKQKQEKSYKNGVAMTFWHCEDSDASKWSSTKLWKKKRNHSLFSTFKLYAGHFKMCHFIFKMPRYLYLLNCTLHSHSVEPLCLYTLVITIVTEPRPSSNPTCVFLFSHASSCFFRRIYMKKLLYYRNHCAFKKIGIFLLTP